MLRLMSLLVLPSLLSIPLSLSRFSLFHFLIETLIIKLRTPEEEEKHNSNSNNGNRIEEGGEYKRNIEMECLSVCPRQLTISNVLAGNKTTTTTKVTTVRAMYS